MNLFFEDNFNTSDIYISLNEEESNHCVKILRYKINDIIHITNGAGFIYKCKFLEYKNKKCLLEIVSSETINPKNYYIHIASALTKNLARIEYFIEKAVEIGINEFTPLIFKHSERIHYKGDRLRKIAISAIKQSHQYYLPIINPVTEFSDFINGIKTSEAQLFLTYQNSETHLKSKLIPNKKYIILIGPEGDFSSDEIQKALTLGFEMVHLGKNRLRTETAALLSCIIAELNNI